jgi:hypothetical protein
MSTDKNLSIEDKKKKYLEDGKKFFPTLDFSNIFSMFNGNSEVAQNGYLELNENIISSTTPVDIIHYTSVEALINIINEGALRVFNCFNLNDPQELKLVLDHLKFSEIEIENIRKNHFIFSACKYKNVDSEKFNNWRLYGDNGNGVALVFTIDSNIEKWKNIFLKDVFYIDNKNNSSIYSEFINFHITFNERYELFRNVPRFFQLLASLQKNVIWSEEEEIRMIIRNEDQNSSTNNSYYDNNAFLTDSIKHTINKNYQETAYLKFPISYNCYENLSEFKSEKLFNDMCNRLPIIKLDKVIFGYQLSNDERKKTIISNFLKNNSLTNLGYQISVYDSIFTKHFK